MTEYEKYLTGKDKESLEQLSSKTRKEGRAAWRSVVRSELGAVNITYDDIGAPEISGTAPWSHIGVSHSKEYAAVIFSDDHCAIDIENKERNFERVSARYISEDEKMLPESSNILFNAVVWCAKEALYKYSKRRGLSLLDDLKITATDLKRGNLTGAIRSPGGDWQEYPMNLIRYDSNLVVYIVTR